ncbi:interferon lambda receptor 1 isoform X1 [Micropterus salmoides]|uniref:interferon lambda receptor 1 isoform X1 n=1 Tax=Micropterus salmoides TaxID=27706 RepID=UPI0018ECD251|nr:interferon lambda receptor 1 isoform X1 [Micropterus salmoides]
MWSMKVIILLLFCYACLSSDNGRVHFVSRNFNNTLHWDAVKPAFPGEEVLYSVQYRSDAVEQQFQIKEDCQNITVLFCDLTTETPSVPDVHYQAQVYVNGNIHGSTIRFKPIADTMLGPPTLSINTTVSSLNVNVTLPLGPNGVSIADIFNTSKNGPSTIVTLYRLYITHPKWAARDNQSSTGQFVINLKNNQTKYCGYVVYMPNFEWGRSKSEKASFCVTLPDDPVMVVPWLLVSVALLVAIVIISVVCMCNYVKGGKEKSMPQQLQAPISSTSVRIMQSPDGNINISKPKVCVQSDHTVYATIQVKPNVRPNGVGGYSPQDVPCQSSQGSIGSYVGKGARSPVPNPEDTSAQSSEIYSVVAVHVPAEENENFHQTTIEDRETSNLPLSSRGESWDKAGMGPKQDSHELRPLLNLKTCESNPDSPLLLKTVRNTNGQLMLPLFTFQLQSSTGDTVSPLNSERKLLLSDLIDSNEGPSLASLQSLDSSEWSDSGCDDSTVNTPTQPSCKTHYFPSQPAVPDFHLRCQNTPSNNAVFESGYKQNWMPETLLGTTYKDSCEYRKTTLPWIMTGPRKEEEGEDEENRGGEERSSQIHLGGWVVQIQE